MIKHIQNETEFYDLLKEGKPIVDFYADWCGPCRMLSPILEQVNVETGIKLLKVNVDKNPEIAKSYGIMSIPTMILFENGKLIEKRVGISSKEEIIKWIKQ